MKRYWLFAGPNYYASGGMKDFLGDFATIDEADLHFESLRKPGDFEWFHIFDTIEKRVVEIQDTCYGEWISQCPVKNPSP